MSLVKVCETGRIGLKLKLTDFNLNWINSVTKQISFNLTRTTCWKRIRDFRKSVL